MNLQGLGGQTIGYKNELLYSAMYELFSNLIQVKLYQAFYHF